MAALRIVFLADTHLGFDYPIKPRVQRRRRGPDFFDNFHRVLDYARRIRPDLVLHGGDLFFRARIPQKIVDLVYEDLFDFAQAGIPIVIVPGNHERSILPASLFLNHPNIFIFDKPATFNFSLDGVKVSLSGFPCQHNNVREKFSGLLSASGWHEINHGAKFLCLHQTIEGSQVGPSNYTFRTGMDVIPQRALPLDATAVLSGHIHRRQILGDRMEGEMRIPPVVYPGSIERTSFAERHERKGFYEIEISQSTSGDWLIDRLDFIQLPARPMVDLYLDHDLSVDMLKPHIQDHIAELADDSIVRFKCSPDLDPQVKEQVTSALLREIMPDTMNYQFSADFRNWE
jgi:DNA repair exonuclease SbcCD nuclease subunit